jgi:hypothetical protein
MLGDEDSERRYRLGMLVVEGTADQVTGLRLVEPEPGEPALAARLQPNQRPTDFGPLRTTGAVRCQVERDRLVLTPLPDEGPCRVELDLAGALGRPATAGSVTAIGAKGVQLRNVPFQTVGPRVVFTTAQDEFSYEVRLK